MAFAEGQLGKMTIIFYPRAEAPGAGGIVFTPMYNPSTLKIDHSVKHECKPLPSAGDIAKNFVRTNPRSMSLELFFDGTGASPSNLSGVGIDVSQLTESPNSVDLQVQTFLKLGYQIAGTLHQPYYLMLIWGSFVMTAVMESANVNYSMFDTDGRPLRATMSISLKEYVDFSLWTKAIKKESSDVSKSITVLAGDTLPLLCFKEYGDPNLYQQIAEVNNLDNYRNLKPGMELLFPPLQPSS